VHVRAEDAAYVERHKSLVRPESVHPTLLNSVHHFQLRAGFKVKFRRRVSTYVADWTEPVNPARLAAQLLRGARHSAPQPQPEVVRCCFCLQIQPHHHRSFIAVLGSCIYMYILQAWSIPSALFISHICNTKL
jgi:hypothetical protein